MRAFLPIVLRSGFCRGGWRCDCADVLAMPSCIADSFSFQSIFFLHGAVSLSGGEGRHRVDEQSGERPRGRVELSRVV